MAERSFFFAGGGTGGHIYPAIAVAEQIIRLDAGAKVHFFCSSRDIDAQILSKTGFKFTPLPAKSLSARPDKMLSFCKAFLASCRLAGEKIAENKPAVVTGVGGFVAAPVCWAAHRLKVPVVLLNVDIVPGRANKIIAHFADEIFVQFDDTATYFVKRKAQVNVVGCPLRRSFENAKPDAIKDRLGLDKNKKTLLVTGASSGSRSINEAICSLLKQLAAFADRWQIVHLTGKADFEDVRRKYADAKIGGAVLEYCDDMLDLLAAADLVIGRSGAVSVAEYAASSVPSICIPYPYHKDRHQYLNAGKLVEAGAAIMVDDLPQRTDTAQWLWEELEPLLTDVDTLKQMKINCATIARKDAALKIAKRLLEIGS
jgi:UDP-N-acetylglucosamine--N-acetylmuramyl-(pentapeptide) pyrophosphoryl-undecaprenol N-acetylglucosamine transferase